MIEYLSYIKLAELWFIGLLATTVLFSAIYFGNKINIKKPKS